MKFSIEFDQVAGGEITLDEFCRPVIPLISSLPGVYCLEATRGGEITTSYVGEAGNLNARLGQYRKSGPPNKTYRKINAWLTESLQGGERIGVSIVKMASADLGGQPFDLDLSEKCVRLLIENAWLLRLKQNGIAVKNS